MLVGPLGGVGGSTAAAQGGGRGGAGDARIAPFSTFQSPPLVRALLSPDGFGTRFSPVDKRKMFLIH